MRFPIQLVFVLFARTFGEGGRRVQTPPLTNSPCRTSGSAELSRGLAATNNFRMREIFKPRSTHHAVVAAGAGGLAYACHGFHARFSASAAATGRPAARAG